MYYAVEDKLYRAKGSFSTHGQLFQTGSGLLTENWNLSSTAIDNSIVPGQIQAFLCSSEKFTWWVEEWQIQRFQNPPVGQTPISFDSKKVYPAKVTGLNVPLRNTSTATINVTFRWREGLTRWGNISNTPINYDASTGNFRPGYGQTIPTDLSRPLKSVTIQTNNLGLQPRLSNEYHVASTLGGLWSMAFYVDPEIAAKYNASNSKKKQKPLNSQDTQTVPTYPAYTPTSGGGYGG